MARSPHTPAAAPDRWETQVLTTIERFGGGCSFSGSSAALRRAVDRCVGRNRVLGRDYRNVGALTADGRRALARAEETGGKPETG